MTKVLVALDAPNAAQAFWIVESLQETGLPFGVKVGMELACAEGHTLIQELSKRGIYVFDDQKRIDIKNTLTQTAKVQLAYGAKMANCMCGSGPAGIRAFADACRERNVTSIGVTVLTTKDDAECDKEFGRTALEQVEFYARWAQDNGLDGVVCSPLELPVIKKKFKLLAVCPGIRPKWAAPNDQKRITTPTKAVRMGADFLVIGRPITSTEYGTPGENLVKVYEEIELAA